MATELQIQQGFATLFRALSIFSSEDVYIDEDDFLDSAIGSAPYLVIWSSQNARYTPAPARLNGVINVPLSLVEEFIGWGATYQQIRANRQTIIDSAFNGVGMSANGLAGVSVQAINILPFVPILPVGVSEEDVNAGAAFPVFIEAPMSIEVELF